MKLSKLRNKSRWKESENSDILRASVQMSIVASSPPDQDLVSEIAEELCARFILFNPFLMCAHNVPRVLEAMEYLKREGVWSLRLVVWEGVICAVMYMLGSFGLQFFGQ